MTQTFLRHVSPMRVPGRWWHQPAKLAAALSSGQARSPRRMSPAVFGSLAGEWLGIFGIFGSLGGLWAWFGDQGFEYLDLGRFWQVLLSLGLFGWVALLFRGLRGRLRREHLGIMPWLFFFSALAIPAFYAVGLLAQPAENFTTTDFWRFWVVHLWVEDFLELFTTSWWLSSLCSWVS